VLYDRKRSVRVKQAAAVKGGSGCSREQALVFFLSGLMEKSGGSQRLHVCVLIRFHFPSITTHLLLRLLHLDERMRQTLDTTNCTCGVLQLKMMHRVSPC
jgi:hypothetical protein